MRTKVHITKIFTLLCLVLSSAVVMAVTRTAINNGNWSDAGTWSPTGVPGAGDDVIIPAGVTVNHNANINFSSINSLTVSGTLNMSSADIIFNNRSERMEVTATGKVHAKNISLPNQNANLGLLKNYGSITLDGNYTAGINLENHEGASFIIKGDAIITPKEHGFSMKNYGYMEITGTLQHNSTIYNYATGVLLVHGSIQGTSKLYIHNYGIVTIGEDLVLYKNILHNYSSGTFIVFGELYIAQGSQVINDGLVQTVHLRYSADTEINGFMNTDGTFIVQDEIRLEGSNCPGCADYVGDLYYGEIVRLSANKIYCNNPNSQECEDFLANRAKQLKQGRRMWYNASFIGYGLGNDQEKIYQWFDLANYYGFKMAQATSANQPKILNNVHDNLNFNPVVNFAGATNYMGMGAADMLSISTLDAGYGVFAVVVPNGNANQKVFDYGNSPTKGVGLEYTESNFRVYTPTSNGGADQTHSHSLGAASSLVSYTAQWGITQRQFLNGELVDSIPITLNKLTAAEIATYPITLGGKSNAQTSDNFQGSIAELIVYGVNVDEPTRHATESFLAIKYGLTLPYNYLNFDKELIYAVDATYKHGIFGLGRQDLNHLHQRQSMSSAEGSNLLLSLGNRTEFDQRKLSGTITNDDSFIVTGHNGNSATDGTRIYKITAKNFNQEIQVAFKFVGIDVYPQLEISSTDDFSSSTFVDKIDYDGTFLTFEYTFPNNATRYFRVGAVSLEEREPGVGINTEDIHPSAQLHIESSDKGVLLPNLTTVQMNAIPTPSEGLIIFNTDVKRFMYNAGTSGAPQWKPIGRFLVQDTTTMKANSGTYLGEIRYNTSTNTLYFWTGDNWKALLDE